MQKPVNGYRLLHKLLGAPHKNKKYEETIFIIYINISICSSCQL